MRTPPPCGRHNCMNYELDLLGSDEAAYRLGVSRTTLYRLVDRGDIMPLGYLGKRRTMVLDAAAVDDYHRRRMDTEPNA